MKDYILRKLQGVIEDNVRETVGKPKINWRMVGLVGFGAALVSGIMVYLQDRKEKADGK